MLDGAGAVPLGGSALSLPSREPVVPAAPETASADLDSRHGQPGDGDLRRPAQIAVSGLAVPAQIAGTASPETAIWAGRRGYTFVPFLVPFDIARELFDYYRQGAAEVGREVTPDKLGFLICAVTADTKTKALEAGRHFVWRMGATLRGPVEFFSPVGMRSRAGSQFALKARPRSLGSMSYEEL